MSGGEALVNDRLLNVYSVMERLGDLSEWKVRRLIATGELSSVQVGRRRMVTESAITAYITGLEKASA